MKSVREACFLFLLSALLFLSFCGGEAVAWIIGLVWLIIGHDVTMRGPDTLKFAGIDNQRIIAT